MRGAFGARFLEGFLWGVALMSFVLLVLRAAGNFYFGSIALGPEKIAAFAILWAVLFIMVGVAEGLPFVDMRQIHPRSVIVLLTGYPGFDSAVEGIRQDVDDYFVNLWTTMR